MVNNVTKATDRAGRRRNGWIDWLIFAASALFVLVLAVSAAFDPSIRVLHTFQAAIYVAVIVLAAKRSAWGYGAGCFIAAFWNWTNLVYTTFIANGVVELTRLVRTGELQRPDQFIAVVAAAAHFLLIAGCVSAFARLRPGASGFARFVGGGLLAIGYFAGIIVLFGPQYVPLLKRVLGL